MRGRCKEKIVSYALAVSLIFGTMFAGNAVPAEAVKSVSLNHIKLVLNLKTKKTAKLNVKKASGITIKKITYKSNNKKIVKVTSAGKVTAKGAGSTKITVKVKYKKKKKTVTKKLLCKVTVKKGNENSVATPAPTPGDATEVQVYEDGDIKVVKPVLPESSPAASGASVLSGSDDSWREESRSWQEQEKQVDMEKFYQDTIGCFLAEEKNTIYSPINVYLALSMLAEVGSGETQSEILNLLQVKDTALLREHIHALWNANYYDTDSAASILGNSLWLNNRVDYNESLLRTLAEYYHASSFSGPMGSEKMNQAVRDWVNEYTKDLLKDSADSIELTADTVMDIISTIYFKAGWRDSFSENLTKRETFHGKSGDKKVDMMHRTSTGYIYSTDKFTGLSLGLSAGNMHFILPNEGVKLSDVIADDDVMNMIGVATDREDLDAKKSHTEHMEIHMSIPKFELHSEIDLTDGLKALGVEKAFNPYTAEFQKLFAVPFGQNAFVSGASHAAMVKIDEEGVTGAAYTEIMMENTAFLEKKSINFVLDRPFYYVVTAEDGSILFAGTAYDI